MKKQALSISSETGKLTAPFPLIESLLGTQLQIEITFLDDEAAPEELPSGTTGRLVCKAPQALGGAVVLLDSSWTHTSGQTTYLLATLADSITLRSLIDAADGDDADFTLRANIEWQLPTEDNPRKSYPFDIRVVNTPSRSDDTAPDVAGQAASDWLDDRSPRFDKSLALTGTERTQLLTNIGNQLQQRLSDDSAYVHLYNPAGIYKGSLRLIDLGQANL
jgi:hypothetical protein